MKCPICDCRIPFDGSKLGGVYCPQCGLKLLVSGSYVSAIAAGVYVAVAAVLWVCLGFNDWALAFLPIFAIPIAGVVTVLALQIVPHVISPPLVLRNFDSYVTLDLSSRDEETDSVSESHSSVITVLGLSGSEDHSDHDPDHAMPR